MHRAAFFCVAPLLSPEPMHHLAGPCLHHAKAVKWTLLTPKEGWEAVAACDAVLQAATHAIQHSCTTYGKHAGCLGWGHATHTACKIASEDIRGRAVGLGAAPEHLQLLHVFVATPEHVLQVPPHPKPSGLAPCYLALLRVCAASGSTLTSGVLGCKSSSAHSKAALQCCMHCVPARGARKSQAWAAGGRLTPHATKSPIPSARTLEPRARLVVRAAEVERVEPERAAQQRGLRRGVPERVDLPPDAGGHAEGVVQELVPDRRLVHHRHVVRRRLVVLHVPAIAQGAGAPPRSVSDGPGCCCCCCCHAPLTSPVWDRRRQVHPAAQTAGVGPASVSPPRDSGLQRM